MQKLLRHIFQIFIILHFCETYHNIHLALSDRCSLLDIRHALCYKPLCQTLPPPAAPLHVLTSVPSSPSVTVVPSLPPRVNFPDGFCNGNIDSLREERRERKRDGGREGGERERERVSVRTTDADVNVKYTWPFGRTFTEFPYASGHSFDM